MTGHGISNILSALVSFTKHANTSLHHLNTAPLITHLMRYTSMRPAVLARHTPHILFFFRLAKTKRAAPIKTTDRVRNLTQAQALRARKSRPRQVIYRFDKRFSKALRAFRRW